MTRVSVGSNLSKQHVPNGLATRMHDDLGGHYMALVEFHVAKQINVADAQQEPGALLAVENIEWAVDAGDADAMRRALKARYEARTSMGTLIEEVLDHAGLKIDSPDVLDILVDRLNADGLMGLDVKARITPKGATVDIVKAPVEL